MIFNVTSETLSQQCSGADVSARCADTCYLGDRVAAKTEVNATHAFLSLNKSHN